MPKNMNWPVTIGVSAAVIGAMIAIGAAVYVAQTLEPLLALIFLAWGVGKIRVANHRDYPWKQATMGVLMGIMYIGLAVAIVYIGDASALLAMILIAWVADAMME